MLELGRDDERLFNAITKTRKARERKHETETKEGGNAIQEGLNNDPIVQGGFVSSAQTV